jgi:hypothetical protein
VPFASRFGNEARSYQFRCRPASDGDCKVSRLNFSRCLEGLLVDICLEQSDVSRWVSTSEFGRQDSAIVRNEFNAISRRFVCSGYISLAPGYTARRRAIFIL